MVACMCRVAQQQIHQVTRFDRVPDGKVCINDLGELAVTKFAVEPVCMRLLTSRSGVAC